MLPSHLTSDSAGALLTTAVGILTPEGSIKTSFQNVRPGWRGLSSFMLAKGMLLDESDQSGRHAAESPDKLAVNKDAKLFTEIFRPESYDVKRYEPGSSLPMLITYLRGLSLGPERGVDPLVDEMRAFVARQEDANVLFVTQRRDVLTDTPGIENRIHGALRDISVAGGLTVGNVMFPGSHTTHTYYLQLTNALHRSLMGQA